MWSENEQQRFDELRQRKSDSSLTEEEQRQLDLLSEELDREDAAYLRPAFEHSRQRQQDLDAEIAQKEARNALLTELAERERELLRRAQEQVEALRREQEMITANTNAR